MLWVISTGHGPWEASCVGQTTQYTDCIFGRVRSGKVRVSSFASKRQVIEGQGLVLRFPSSVLGHIPLFGLPFFLQVSFAIFSSPVLFSGVFRCVPAISFSETCSLYVSITSSFNPLLQPFSVRFPPNIVLKTSFPTFLAPESTNFGHVFVREQDKEITCYTLKYHKIGSEGTPPHNSSIWY